MQRERQPRGIRHDPGAPDQPVAPDSLKEVNARDERVGHRHPRRWILSFASAVVCHCIFDGLSAPPQASGTCRSNCRFASSLRTDRPITDLRDMLDRVAVRAGFLKPVLDERTGKQASGANGWLLWTGQRIRTRPFRVSYTAARRQTLDRGAPVSLEMIAGELGHASRDIVERVYKRIGKVRHRSEAVEFRWEQWFEERGGELREKENARLAPVGRTRRATTSLTLWARRDSNPRPLAPEASALSN